CPPVFEHRPMARLLRIACFIAAPITAWAMLGVLPAAAQFFNPFEALFGQPPRPPSSVPSGRPQQAYPPYPDPPYPHQPSPHPPPPPPLSGAPEQSGARPSRGAAGRPRRGAVQPPPSPPPGGPPGGAPPPARPRPRGPPHPADTSPQPGDEVIAEPLSQKI